MEQMFYENAANMVLMKTVSKLSELIAEGGWRVIQILITGN